MKLLCGTEGTRCSHQQELFENSAMKHHELRFVIRRARKARAASRVVKTGSTLVSENVAVFTLYSWSIPFTVARSTDCSLRVLNWP